MSDRIDDKWKVLVKACAMSQDVGIPLAPDKNAYLNMDGVKAILRADNLMKKIIEFESLIDALERDRVTLRIMSQMICEAHTATGRVHDAAFYDGLYELAYNALPAERQAQFPRPETVKQAEPVDLGSGAMSRADDPPAPPAVMTTSATGEKVSWYAVGFDGKQNAHFDPAILCSCENPGYDNGSPAMCPVCGKLHRR